MDGMLVSFLCLLVFYLKPLALQIKAGAVDALNPFGQW